MGERNWNHLNDEMFEQLLEESVPERPPESVVAGVTPWAGAMNRVLVGMALSSVTLQFWGLQYLLPAIGMVLLLLGFRTLRRENRWFGVCFLLMVLRVAAVFLALMLNTTIMGGAGVGALVLTGLGWAELLLLFAGVLCFRLGLREVYQKAGLPPRTGSASALAVWYGLVCVLGAIQYQGLMIGLGMLAGYFLILRSLYRISGELEEAGYAIQAAPVRVSDRGTALALAVVLCLGCACGYLLGGSYPMEWKPVDDAEQSGVEEIRNRLLELGFPGYVLDDLSPEDVAACAGAAEVVVDVTDEPVNEGRTVTTEYGRGEKHYVQQKTVYDERELRITGVAVRLDGARERWMIFHHFLWTMDPGFYGTESIQMWPTYRGIPEGWAADGQVTGRVLYDSGGSRFAAPYHFLGEKTFVSDSIFWGEESRSDIFAAFSMPCEGERHRGYVAYPVAELEDGYLLDSWINYTHQRSWFQYPVRTAMETRMKNSWNDAGAFLTVQDALQFYPQENGAEGVN